MASQVSILVARHQARCELCGEAGHSADGPVSRPALRARVRALLSSRLDARRSRLEIAKPDRRS